MRVRQIFNNNKNLFAGVALLAVVGILAAGRPGMTAVAVAAEVSQPGGRTAEMQEEVPEKVQEEKQKERQNESRQEVNPQEHRYIISQDGTGDFRTIQEGVDYASSGDTLIVYPGVYNETVQVMAKEINITGVSKETCILQCDTASYRKAPLTIASGRISNLTIYGMSSGAGEVVLTEEEIARINAELIGDSWDRQKNYRGYAVHVDQDFLYGRSVSFENCRIISENNHCAGIGTRGESTVRFERCELISLGGGSCIFMHDPPAEGVSGKAALIVKDCSMTSYLCPYVMTFQSMLPEYNSFVLTFQNTRVSAVEYAYDGSYVSMNVNTSFDVDTLSALEKAGGLYMTGLSSSAAELVHEMTTKDMLIYMEELGEALETGNAANVVTLSLPEGITRIGYLEGDENVIAPSGVLKHQVIAIYNISNQPGYGWCGLDNACLTSDSYGNTLVEMNAVTIPNIADDAQVLHFSDSADGH